jgi:dTDP-4-dehydrorhamnose reductase
VVNGTGVQYLASACADSGAALLHVSTDYVFPGDATSPIHEDAPTGPINAYGRSKLVGEQAVFEALPDAGYVVRTAWLYGEHGKNFVTTILNAAKQRDFLDVVDDQRGQPTWARALARQLIALGGAALAGHAPAGAYHGTSSGETTWYGLARQAFELTGLDPDRIRPTTSDKFPRPAPRPSYSVLGHERWALAGLGPMPDWDASLRDYLHP